MRPRLGGTVIGIVVGALLSFAAEAAQDDVLDIGREFDAFTDPAKAAEMIRTCEAQTEHVRQGIVRWRNLIDAFKTELVAYKRLEQEVDRVDEALNEARTHASTLSGEAAARFEAEVLEERRKKYVEAYDRLDAATPAFDGILERTRAEARSIIAFFRSIGLRESDYAGSPDAVMHRQTELCRRLRAWAQQGTQTRAQMAVPPSPEVWPSGAIGAWKSEWSCRWQSTVGGQTLTTTITAHSNAWYEDDGTVLVHFSTETARNWPSNRSSRIFSPLIVTKEQPMRGAFRNRDGLGEDRVRPDVIDIGVLGNDGRLSLQRRYAMSPGSADDLTCTR